MEDGCTLSPESISSPAPGLIQARRKKEFSQSHILENYGYFHFN